MPEDLIEKFREDIRRELEHRIDIITKETLGEEAPKLILGITELRTRGFLTEREWHDLAEKLRAKIKEVIA